VNGPRRAGRARGVPGRHASANSSPGQRGGVPRPGLRARLDPAGAAAARRGSGDRTRGARRGLRRRSRCDRGVQPQRAARAEPRAARRPGRRRVRPRALWDAEREWIEMRLRALRPMAGDGARPRAWSSEFAGGRRMRTEISAKFRPTASPPSWPPQVAARADLGGSAGAVRADAAAERCRTGGGPRGVAATKELGEDGAVHVDAEEAGPVAGVASFHLIREPQWRARSRSPGSARTGCACAAPRRALRPAARHRPRAPPRGAICARSALFAVWDERRGARALRGGLVRRACAGAGARGGEVSGVRLGLLSGHGRWSGRDLLADSAPARRAQPRRRRPGRRPHAVPPSARRAGTGSARPAAGRPPRWPARAACVPSWHRRGARRAAGHLQHLVRRGRRRRFARSPGTAR
jgi:hypothetical protein